MIYDNQLPEWKNEGTEPSQSLKNNGFTGGYKPPAGVFNWFWSKVSKAIKELQTKAAPIEDMTGTCQLSAYRKTVIALCEAPTTASGLNSYSNGRLVFQRGNGLLQTVAVDVAMNAAYGAVGKVHASVIRLHGKSMLLNPCTFQYDGVTYGGLEVQIDNAEFKTVKFLGVSNFNVFAVDYYDTNLNVVINDEVAGTISYDNVSLLSSIKANGNTVFDEGNYRDYVPTRTGEGAYGVWGIEARKATELSTYCKTPSNGNVNVGKWIKFATVDVTAANWLYGGGCFSISATENTGIDGILAVTVRRGSTIGQCTLRLKWLALSNVLYSDAVALVKARDGVYDVYFQMKEAYHTIKVVAINPSNTTLYAADNTEYLAEITAAVQSTYTIDYSVLENTPADYVVDTGTYWSDAKPWEYVKWNNGAVDLYMNTTFEGVNCTKNTLEGYKYSDPIVIGVPDWVTSLETATIAGGSPNHILTPAIYVNTANKNVRYFLYGIGSTTSASGAVYITARGKWK